MRNSICVLGSLLAVCISIMFSPSARAQFNAALQGTVKDTSGAAVPSAQVTITNQDTGVVQTTTAGSEGFYRFSSLPPGAYTVKVEAKGFQTEVTTDVGVSAELVRGFDAVLRVGKVSQSVVVNGAMAPALQSEDASISGTLTSEEVQRLPAFNRDPYELLRLSPGVFGDGARMANGNSTGFPNGAGGNGGSAGPGGSDVAIFQTENQQPISSSGQRVTSNDYSVDGVSVNSLEWGGAAVITPSVDSVQQITVLSNDYDASDGRNSGAHIKVVTKSGTNAFHGGGFFQFEDPGLNAFNKYGGYNFGVGFTPPIRNDDAFRQFGANLGGPIIHNKLFFFFNYEGLRDKDTTFEDNWVDTPQFDQTLVAARPGTPVATTLADSGILPRIKEVLPTTCTLWIAANQPCQVVPGGLDIGSPGGTYGNYIYSFGCQNTLSNPNPNCPGTANPNCPSGSITCVLPNYTGGGLDGIPDVEFAELYLPNLRSGNQYNVRLDYVRGQNLFSGNVFLTYLDQTTSDGAAQGRPMADITDHRFSPSGFLSWVDTISPTLVNEARFNFTRYGFDEVASNPQVNWGIPRTEIQGLPINGQRIIFGAAQGDGTPGIFGENTFAWRDVVTKVFSRHSLKLGFEGDRAQDNDNLNGSARPDYVFQGPWNLANGTPIFEQIAVDPSTGGVPFEKPRYFRTTDFGLFVQDDWKFRPNLTINLGLRWDYFGPPTEALGNLENIIPGSGPTGLQTARAVIPKQMYDTTWRNFGPRIGFAWAPSKLENKAVVRGGFGIAYDRFDDNSFDNTRDNPPLVANYGICCGTAPGEFGSPFVNGQILYEGGSSKSPFSYPANPALITPLDPTTHLPMILAGQSAPNVYANFPTKMPIPYVYMYSLQVQYSLPKSWVVTAGYVGSSSHDLLRIANLAYFYPVQNPFISNVYDFLPDTFANYNALVTTAQHQFGRNFLLNISYTYSKSIDDVSAEGPGFTTNQTYPVDLATERGPSDYDATHYLTVFGLWNLPIFNGRHDALGKTLGGWQLNGIFTFHSGFPWTPVASNLCPVLGSSSLCPLRPTGYLGGAKGAHDTNAFLPPTSGVFPNPSTSYFTLETTGTAPDFPGIGRNTFRGPRYSDFDFSIVKSFGLPTMKFVGENGQIQLRLNLYNAFNKLNLAPFVFGSQSTTISYSQTCTGTVCTPQPNQFFGLATTGLSGRTMELEGRFVF
jgi:hypothetical protein